MFLGCNAFKVGMAIFSLVTTTLKGNPTTILIGIAIDVAISAASMAIIEGMSALIANLAAPRADVNLLTDFLDPTDSSKDAEAKQRTGYAFLEGTKLFQDKSYQMQGGAIANEESYAKFHREKQIILAEEAEYDRATRSPFDITSQNTFLGSIVYKTLPMLSGFSSLGGRFSQFMNIVGNSFASILPTASALSETNLSESFGDCPSLESVGAVGNAFCDPYYATDFSTIEINPDIVFENAMLDSLGLNNFETEPDGSIKTNGEGNPIIARNSELMKYKVTCGARDAQLGYHDASSASIVASLTAMVGIDDPTASKVTNFLAGNVPILDDLQTITESALEAGNIGWIYGDNCVVGGGNWEKTRWYERYLNDQDQFEAMGAIEKSEGTAALERYYEEHPLDASYEGVLARYSGMTKEQVVAVLDYIDYAQYVAAYNPGDRLPVEAPATLTLAMLFQDETTFFKHGAVTLVAMPVFVPLRGRAVASA
jgi:hypothetical protein